MNTFYGRLRKKRQDNDELAQCIHRLVKKLKENSTTNDRPGILLGKIQSGKTRGFIGVIAAAFDQGFDIALVLTKGTKTLSAQTVSRLSSDFAEFIEEDQLLVLDIMKLPDNLTESELNRKIVIVAKKQIQNLKRLIKFITKYAVLKSRHVLLVDDEADLVSVRFVAPEEELTVTQGKIAEQMDKLRTMLETIAFLQVTATPYSLYLQPDDYEATKAGSHIFKPKKPAFTELLPIHGGYVGSDDYFGGHDEDDPRHYLIVKVASHEQDALRRSIITFVLAASIRRWQQEKRAEEKQQYAMIIHNDTRKAAHDWQNLVVEWIFDAIRSVPTILRPLFDAAFNDLKASVSANNGEMPSPDEIYPVFIDAFKNDDALCLAVNSDINVMGLLDEKAELKLWKPYNIYVGGNILDRGITIPNLIAFYYGRNPLIMQADTVLQHSHMYGNRSRSDLAVTRLYISQEIYVRLCAINSLENALREAFESGAHDRGVVFMKSDSSHRIRPCAPNKVLLSKITATSPNDLLLPTSFKTAAGARMIEIQEKLEKLIAPEMRDSGNFVETSRKHVFSILDLIEASMIFNNGSFDWNTMRGLFDYYSGIHAEGNQSILLMAETGRKLNRSKSGDKSGLSVLGASLRKKVMSTCRIKPALVLLQQEGGETRGWTAHKFWWPIFVAPSFGETCIFASKTAI